jgi:hypothetical protein
MRLRNTLALALAAWAVCILYAFGQVPTNQISTTLPPAPPDADRTRLEIRSVEGLLPKIPDRGAAMYFLARRYAHLGDLLKAFARLTECMSLEEGFDPGDAPAFEPLKPLPQFQQLVEQARRRYQPVHHARIVFTIQERDLFPEGLAVDPARHVFYMGSMHRKKIIRITEKGEVSDFVSPNLYDLMPVGGIKVDPLDHSVWAATDPGEKNRSELVHFDARANLLARSPATGAGRHDLNDLVIRNAREIYVTDTSANQVYRFDLEAATFTPLIFSRPVLYPNGIVLSADGNQLYVGDILGVLRLDLLSNTAQEVNAGKNNTLAGIDGLYWYKGDLLGVQYGTGSYRVARWRLSSDGLHVTSTQVLEYRSPLISFPTTGAIYEGQFYFISNTGIANLKDDKVVDPSKLEPIHISVVPLN